MTLRQQPPARGQSGGEEGAGDRPKVMHCSVICYFKSERSVFRMTAESVDFVSDFDGRRLTPTSVPVEIARTLFDALEEAQA